jgi:hypothetical protein
MTAQTRLILKAISYIGLAVSIIPAFLVFAGVLSKQVYLNLMIVGMVLWFGSAIFWVKRDHLNG